MHNVGILSFLSWINCIRIIKMTNYKRLIDQMMILPATRVALRMFYMVCMLLVITHFVSCFWNWISETGDRHWIPPLNWVHAGTPFIKKFEFEESTEMKRYLTMYYYAVLSFGANELGAKTSLEIFVITIILIAQMFYINNWMGDFVFLR